MRIEEREIVLACVEYQDSSGGKKRPAIVLSVNSEEVYVYQITSKFEDKSPYYQKAYFEIKDWGEANLDKPSWIDTSEYYILSNKFVFKVIGNLSRNDWNRFRHFLINKFDIE